LVDDSIVRGTTSEQIIQMARDAGAKKVYIASAAPAVKFPNVYGIDMPSVNELIAHGRTDAEVAQAIGADWLIYQDLADLIESSSEGNPNITAFDCAVFDGNYVTDDVTQEYLDKLSAARSDSQQDKQRELDLGSANVVGIHNDTAEA
jgi:amidophosphoribosyltransferase